ncbi:MAG: phycobiliprotein lyase [Aphanocapsa feldmannii 277cI]|uniref:Chromophore lyase CpcS/CpeS n=1 Tax=Aphanocapsa feldmannii 277cI TaxID=2507554 RepID=A0A524RSZ3_9CHRO|nr:MAG: phycobiliprotein lyase [Aphanocapsa feldmannii 288cV]TGH21023.1 MAG: phycobiliprotein lyase [Aphanocapsa feldmannii 277cI]
MASSIDSFVQRSLGTWESKRSGHNLAFRHVEEVESTIEILPVSLDDPGLAELLASHGIPADSIASPFHMAWEGTSDWDEDATSKGSCTLVPLPSDNSNGRLLRSTGYTEQIPAIGTYRFSDDGCFILITPYEGSSAEERIWFATNDVRMRVSMMRTQSGRGVLQASFSSEIRSGS